MEKASIISRLPDEIFILILTEWLEKQEEVSSLDIALVNSSLRNKYLTCLVQLQCKFLSVIFDLRSHFPYTICQKRLVKLVEWLKLRNTSLSKLSVGPLQTTTFATISWSTLNGLRELYIFLNNIPFNARSCVSIDLDVVLAHLPALQTLTLIAEDVVNLTIYHDPSRSVQSLHLVQMELQGFSFPSSLELQGFLDHFAHKFASLQSLKLTDIAQMNIDYLWYLVRQLPKLSSVSFANPRYPSSPSLSVSSSSSILTFSSPSMSSVSDEPSVLLLSGEEETVLKTHEYVSRKSASMAAHRTPPLRQIDLCCSGEINQQGSVGLWRMFACSSLRGRLLNDSRGGDSELESVVLRNVVLCDADGARLSACMASWQQLRSFAAYYCKWDRVDVLAMLCSEHYCSI